MTTFMNNASAMTVLGLGLLIDLRVQLKGQKQEK